MASSNTPHGPALLNPSSKAVNIGRVVREMDDLLRRSLGEAVELETVISGGLWHAQAEVCDIQNALLNLAINARNAMGGRGRLTLEVGNAVLEEAEYVMLAVADTRTEASQGAELGLSIVYGFVKQLGGHVDVASNAGHGTIVKIYLPRSLQGEERAAAPAPGAAAPLRVLVVEDDVLIRMSLAEMLESRGHTVFEAGDGNEAIRQHANQTFDVLLTDVGLPGMSGVELAERMREAQPGLPVLFATGDYAVGGVVRDARTTVIVKPYGVADLTEAIGRITHA